MTRTEAGKFPPVPGVVLAAGRSLRMGRPKALLPWPATGQPFVTHVTRTLREAGASPVCVVTGAHHALIAPVLEGAGIPVTFNPRHDEGQLASLQHGLHWGFSQTEGDWVLVTLVDVPGVQVATTRALLDAARSSSVSAVRPALGARHGHPVLWHRDTLASIDAADPALGGRSIMHALAAAGQVLDVPVTDTGVLVDVDTPEAYAQLARAASSGPGPR
jgi:molybdenum cofactor cytidylyltransferase